MAHLDTIADRQAQWSETANQLKATIDNARWLVFVLSILGALAATIAGQMSPPDPGALASSPRTWVAIIGVVCLAAATFFTSRLLGTAHVTDWVRARALAEALKREAYKFAAKAAPYDGADRPQAAQLLEQERIKIEKDGEDLLPKQVPAKGPGSTPRQDLSQDDYLARRVNDQIKWYRDKAQDYGKIARRLRQTEFALALAATLITALATVSGKSPLIAGMTFDIAALTAVLTTIAGSILAHVEASRFDFLVMSYLAAGRRLEDRRGGAQAPWSDFVNDCENILAAENASWIGKWTK
jgi:hypothetical protein